jgi:hypothetical protein
MFFEKSSYPLSGLRTPALREELGQSDVSLTNPLTWNQSNNGSKVPDSLKRKTA